MIDTKRTRNLKLEMKEMKTMKLDLRKTKEMELDWKKTKETTPDMKKMKKTNPDMREAEFDTSKTNPERWTLMQKDLDVEEAKKSFELNPRTVVSPRLSKIKKSPEAQIDPLIHWAKRDR